MNGLTTIERAFITGIKARERGVDIKRNPWPPRYVGVYQAWENGWLCADHEIACE